MEIINKYDINYLSKINKHVLDESISFEEETHVYTVHNNKDYVSVTTFIHSLFPCFNEDKIINNILKSKKYNNPDYKYYNKTKEEILNMWNENRIYAANLGTQMHYFIECYYDCLYNPNLNFEKLFTNKQNQDFTLKNNIEYQYFMNFVNDNLNLIPYRTEWCIYDTQLKLAGSIDMVFTDKNNKFYIYDWKRSKEIKKTNNYNETSLLPILDYIPNSNYWHYTLQLNIYKAMLERNYNIIIDSLYLVIIYPENKNYIKICVPIMNELINELFIYRHNLINNNNQ